MLVKKTNAMRILDAKHISYIEYHYEVKDDFESMHVVEVLNQPAEKIYKTLVTEGKSKKNYVFVIPIIHELNLKKAAKVVREKSIAMIPMKEILPLSGYIRGGCSPIGMKKQFETVLDESAKNQQGIIVSGGKRGFHIELSPDDLLFAVNGRYANISSN
ncbi:Cys-tRNA(Pro)/Cys-tRNA(Cys) deacylase [Breznakia sp. PF5-3]|uniref:Cys-tRNA(Pro) deacylase n=1 Tax=unclassified Breznakia TaxID=2623764 RepID=UPI002406CE68|nr:MULTISPECIES: Cys-tRNA(Pro) deacylase [unclassified Breznakia]MDF9824961.1 Cys-tRNA(Pro)/Cys-tRNA(Cys) deacylase [Breznakia sp. PM6-1]MDF9835846.1 Cys-tRNA(Pro)/Cys-tRNA(Cys) deacylase [Breznakia sp. PF5-3]MDF9836902.1 Cys-tRNA(Pro)/Cys-tRNA(Cys) deacylase [Breznakia sp. PFB2-8]MDF9859848.1 Cys-tRNA(Pro)/Cys-tRNA(Cys) deacylase [Breznakia sp. PH5-24]